MLIEPELNGLEARELADVDRGARERGGQLEATVVADHDPLA